MKYRSLGNTGLEVSILAYGGSSLGSVFEEISETEGIRSVHTALDHGINLIDTAPFYGLTRAETVLGKALRSLSRDAYLLATKVGRYGYKQKDFDFSAERVLRSIDESLLRLGVDSIDFIQVHDMEFGPMSLIMNETIPALLRAKEIGKVRFVGFSALPLRLLREVAEALPIDQVQSYCHYCLNDSSLLELLLRFYEKGLAIFNSARSRACCVSCVGNRDLRICASIFWRPNAA